MNLLGESSWANPNASNKGANAKNDDVAVDTDGMNDYSTGVGKFFLFSMKLNIVL